MLVKVLQDLSKYEAKARGAKRAKVKMIFASSTFHSSNHLNKEKEAI